MFAPAVDPGLVSVFFNDGKFCSFALLLVFVDTADGEAMLRSAITQTEWLFFLRGYWRNDDDFLANLNDINMISGFIDLGM